MVGELRFRLSQAAGTGEACLTTGVSGRTSAGPPGRQIADLIALVGHFW